jgi:hypothetical protein
VGHQYTGAEGADDLGRRNSISSLTETSYSFSQDHGFIYLCN